MYAFAHVYSFLWHSQVLKGNNKLQQRKQDSRRKKQQILVADQINLVSSYNLILHSLDYNKLAKFVYNQPKQIYKCIL